MASYKMVPSQAVIPLASARAASASISQTRAAFCFVGFGFGSAPDNLSGLSDFMNSRHRDWHVPGRNAEGRRANCHIRHAFNLREGINQLKWMSSKTHRHACR